MMYLLLIGPKRYSMDPRNALFSLHGIASGFMDDVPFEPDYRRADVFANLAAKSLATTFAMLVFAKGSWVPDYTGRQLSLEA